ncbi:ABC transporter permease [Shouchella shacheensis]|uniref:ABC transporter permease n=1 Tax=Shouchella shacheensis TaxID=1649580 RepID=UPI000A50ABA5|nr:ABC transporter permease [Shouchella shacheensis]
MQIRKVTFFILGKVLKMATLLFALSLISFWLLSHSPVDPVQAYIGADMMQVSPEQRERIAAYWGLDKSMPEQFWLWFTSVIKGDLGTSMIFRSPVSSVIAERFTASFALMAIAWLVSGFVGFSLGVVAAMKQRTWMDRVIKWYCLTLASTPTFWFGLLLLIVFSVWLGWFPVGLGVPAGTLAEDVTLFDRGWHLILPALTLSVVGVANVALHTRQKLVGVLESDFIHFAKARGEKGFSLFWRHGLRNVAMPAISLHFASLGGLFGGAVLAEQVFSYPGLGQATVQAGLQGDIPLLLGVVLFSAIFVFVGNLIADLLYHVIDPRMRNERMV